MHVSISNKTETYNSHQAKRRTTTSNTIRIEKSCLVVNYFPPQPSKNIKQLLFGCENHTRSALLAGGAGGIGALWAKHLSAESMILLGRSVREAVGPMKVVEQLMQGALLKTFSKDVRVWNSEYLLVVFVVFVLGWVSRF